jgi:hypothetical protein
MNIIFLFFISFIYKNQIMDQLPVQANSFFSSDQTGGIDNKTIIIVLLVLLSLSFLGINLLTIFGDLIKTIADILGPLVSQILSIFGYTTGSIINKTADVVGDVAKTGVDIAEGSVQSVGTILRDASRPNVDSRATNSLDNALNVQSTSAGEPAPTPSENPIQKPITSGKSGWCLVGEYEGKRGCISVNDYDKCLSGQVYASKDQCLLPPPQQR